METRHQSSWRGKTRLASSELKMDEAVVRTVGVLALVIAVAAISVAATRLFTAGAASTSVAVTVDGRSVSLADGTTLGQAIAIFGLRPRAGELLDVERKPLRPDGTPGRVVVDGLPEHGRALLRSGDRISVVDGANKTELLARQVARVPGGEPRNPQFTLSLAPGKELVVRGAISHELVSARFQPTGSARAERAVALTFDDGPSPEYTPRILATLHRLRVPATFFVIGYLAQEYPTLVRREMQLGMEVGNHSYNHPEVPPFDQLPPTLIADEITLSNTILTGLGARPQLFRPPGGSVSPTVVHTAATLGERIVLWSVDPTDWSPGTTANEIIKRVLSAVRPGSIVILHDGGGDRSATLTALPAIVRGIRKRNLRLVAITPGPTTTINLTINR